MNTSEWTRQNEYVRMNASKWIRKNERVKMKRVEKKRVKIKRVEKKRVEMKLVETNTSKWLAKMKFNQNLYLKNKKIWNKQYCLTLCCLFPMKYDKFNKPQSGQLEALISFSKAMSQYSRWLNFNCLKPYSSN